MRPLCLCMMVGILLNASFVCRGATPERPTKDSLVRRWTDSTGRFHTNGILLGSNQSQVRLQKVPGSVITVSLDRLSEPDRQFVLDARKSSQAASGSAGEGWLSELAAGLTSEATPASAESNAVASVGQLLLESPPPMPQNIVYVRLSRQFLQRLTLREVSRSEPVYDYILGSNVTGTSQTVGSTEFILQPSNQSGLAEVRFTGATTFNTVADAGRIQVLLCGTTRFAAAKAFRFDSDGIHAGPAVTNAIASTTITGIQTSLPGLRGRIARRIGSRRAEEDHAEAEAITAQHTEWKIDRRFDESANDDIARLTQRIRAQVATLPPDDPLRRCTWRARSTKDALQIALLEPTNDKEKLVPPPSPALADAEIEVQVHSAFVRRYMLDAKLQKLLEPLMEASKSGSPSRGMPAGRPIMHWSRDHTWLSLDWKNGEHPAEPARTSGGTLASEPH